MAIDRWLKMFCALVLAATSLGCEGSPANPSFETAHFSLIHTPKKDYCGNLMSWKMAHPTRRIINLLPYQHYISQYYEPGGFVIHSLDMGRSVQQFFIILPVSRSEKFGVDHVESWISKYPEVEILAMATLNRDSAIDGYLICFEMPSGTPLPDSLAHYYESLPVEPSEFTPLTDAKAPLMETTLP